jgi:hypothetical protein
MEVPFGSEPVDLSTVQFTPELLSCIPAELVRKYRALPVFESRGCLGIVMSEMDLNALDDLACSLRRELEVRFAEKLQLDDFIQRLYGDDRPVS